MEVGTNEATKEKTKTEKKGELEEKIELLEPSTKTKIVETKLDKLYIREQGVQAKVLAPSKDKIEPPMDIDS